VSAELFEKLEQFTCAMYAGSRSNNSGSSTTGDNNVNELRYQLFCAERGSRVKPAATMQRLPLPTRSNLCLVSSLSMSMGQSFQFLIRSRYSVQHLIPTSQWNLTPKLYPVPAFITFAHLNRFVRPWMTAWLVPWRLRLFHSVLIMLTLSYTVRRRRI